MAIDYKKLIADATLALCREQDVKTITVKQILQVSGVSRQTFYNHFADRYDLIQYIYLHYISFDFVEATDGFDFGTSLLRSFEQMKRYDYFLVPACRIQGQNNLNDFIYDHAVEFDTAWHERLYGMRLTDELRFAVRYHAMASAGMAREWILAGMKEPPKVVAARITTMRSLGMGPLLAKDPYQLTSE